MSWPSRRCGKGVAIAIRLDGPSGVVAPPLVSGCETSLRVRLGILSVMAGGGVLRGESDLVDVGSSAEVSCNSEAVSSSASSCDGPLVTRLRGLSRLTWLTDSLLTIGESDRPVNAERFILC
jgi:hypothetical protein